MSDQLIKEGLTVLKEVFNRPYPMDGPTYVRPSEVAYTSQTDDGRIIKIFIRKMAVGKVFKIEDIKFNRELASNHGWNNTHKIGDVIFIVGDKMAATGQGDAPRIFATVVKALNDHFDNDRDLVGYTFEGYGESRSKLYLTMIRRMARQFNYEPVMLDHSPSRIKRNTRVVTILANKKRAPYLFVDEVKEDIAINNIKEDYKVDYGGATPFNNAFRRYMSDFYPPDQDNEGFRMHDVMGAMLGHRIGLISTEDIKKLQQTYNEREREAGRQRDRDQYLNPVYQQRMRDIYTGKISPGELGTVPGGEGTLANKAYNDALRRGTNKDRMKDIAKSLLAKRPRSSLKPGIQEDIGPKTSKQSIRPYVRNAVRGLRK